MPATAIGSTGTDTWVLRVRDGKAERVPVELGLRDERAGKVELRSGVSEGDVLLTGAAQAVTPGTPVDVAQEARAAARGEPVDVHLRLRHQPPDHHRRVDAGARGVRHRRSGDAEDRRVPRRAGRRSWSVSLLYPGAAPENVEREVIEPVEDAISGISGVNRINSSSLDSFGLVIVEFVFEKDLQEATQDIRDEIGIIRADLPPEMEEPVLTRFDPGRLADRLADARVDAARRARS